MEVKSYRNPGDTRVTMAVTFDETGIINRAAMEGIISEVVRSIADRYVKENYAEIIASLDQKAIANLSIAEAGKKIAEEIRQRPVVVREQGNTVNKYSIF